jgi:hypothetical protein
VAQFYLDRCSESLSWEKRAGGQSGAWESSASDSRSGSDEGNGGAVARRGFLIVESAVLAVQACPGGGGIGHGIAREAGAQCRGQGRYDQALVGAERSRVGIPPSPRLRRTGWLGLHDFSKPDDPPSLPPSLKLWWTGKLRRDRQHGKA